MATNVISWNWNVISKYIVLSKIPLVWKTTEILMANYKRLFFIKQTFHWVNENWKFEVKKPKDLYQNTSQGAENLLQLELIIKGGIIFKRIRKCTPFRTKPVPSQKHHPSSYYYCWRRFTDSSLTKVYKRWLYFFKNCGHAAAIKRFLSPHQSTNSVQILK